MGVICCLWLGARRAGHALLSALAYPALGLLLVTLLLAYSRGALVALALGPGAVVLHRAAAPARRGRAAGRRGSAPGAWWRGTSPPRAEHRRRRAGARGSPATARRAARRDGLLLTLVGRRHRLLSPRRLRLAAVARRRGRGAVALLALVVVAFAGRSRPASAGFTGSISHALQLAHQPARASPRQHARAADRGRAACARATGRRR